MRITDAWRQPTGEIMACGLGEDITPGFTCKRIEVDGKEIEVIKTGVSASLCGKMIMLMQLNVKKTGEVPLGDVKVIQ